MASSISIANLPDSVRSLIESIQPPVSTGSNEKDEEAVTSWLALLQNQETTSDLASLDDKLTPKTYLVGNDLTLADVALYGLLYPSVSKLDKASYYKLPSLTRWYDHVQNTPSISSALSKTTALGFKPIQFDIENAPKLERSTEPPAKKEKKDKEGVPAPVVAATNDHTSTTGKKEKKEKKGGKEKAGTQAASTEQPAATAKPSKAPKTAAAPAADDSKSIPSMIDLRVGHILDVKKHPDADGLYVETIDLGEPEGPRTVVSGLVNYIPIEQMQDRWLVAVCNLKPVAMRGVKSYAMVLCATSKEGKEGGIEIVNVPEESKIPGEKIYFEGAEFEGKKPLTQLNPKKKIFETIQPGFITLPSRECAWVNPETGSSHRIRTKAGVCTAPTFVAATLS